MFEQQTSGLLENDLVNEKQKIESNKRQPQMLLDKITQKPLTL